MRILTHPMHTSCDYTLATIGHMFYAPKALGWDTGQRPNPQNWIIGDGSAYDACIVGTYHGYLMFRDTTLPMIYYQVCNLGSGPFPGDVENRCSAVVFTCQECAARWEFTNPSKKCVIEHAIDTDEYHGYRGDGQDILTVANCYPKRPAEWYNWLLRLSERTNLELVGVGNNGVKCSVGHAADHEDLKERYRRYKVYVNPATDLTLAVLEAMATGMPVITFRPITFTDLVVDGVNGFVVDSVEDAVHRIELLLSCVELRVEMGKRIRQAVKTRMHPNLFKVRWNSLLTACVK